MRSMFRICTGGAGFLGTSFLADASHVSMAIHDTGGEDENL